MSGPVRLLVVDDSAFVRRAVERMAEGWPDVEVVGVASDGLDALELNERLRPEVILLDVNMPEMNGLEALQRIMERAPTAVILMSTLTRAGADVTMRGLELGALDFIDKTWAGNTMDFHSLAPLIREKVLGVAGSDARAGGIAEAPSPVSPPLRLDPATRGCRYELVAIGASTGGPRALSVLVPALPEGFGAAVVVAQHMPPGFTATLAERLDGRSTLEVAEGADGEVLRPGRVLIAPGGHVATVERRGTELVLRARPPDERLLHLPSVDRLLSSVAVACGPRAVGVVLTGMGEDGARGLKELLEAGGRTLVESEETTVIYGMPRAARGAAERVLPLEAIAREIVTLCAAEEVPGGEWPASS